jgi:hypothetical protein
VRERVRGALPFLQLSGVKAPVAGRCSVCARPIVGPGDGVTDMNGDAAGREPEVGDRDRWISRGVGANRVSHTSSPRCAPRLPDFAWRCRPGLRGAGRWCCVGLRGARLRCRMDLPVGRRCGGDDGEVGRHAPRGRCNGHLHRYVAPAGACVRVSDGRERAGVRRVLRAPNEVPAVIGGAGRRVEHLESDWAARRGTEGHRGHHKRRRDPLGPGCRLRRRDGNIGFGNRGRRDIGLRDTDVREDR